MYVYKMCRKKRKCVEGSDENKFTTNFNKEVKF